MKKLTSLRKTKSVRKEKRDSAIMATQNPASAAPTRQSTLASTASDEAVPDTDPSTVSRSAG